MLKNIAVVLIGTIILYATVLQAHDENAAELLDTEVFEAETVFVEPQFPGSETSAPQLSPAEREALMERLHQRREAAAAEVDNNPPSPPGVESEPVPPTNATFLDANNSEWPGDPTQFLIGLNSRNTRANNPAVGSTLAEPVAVNNGKTIVSAGNWHIEYTFFMGQPGSYVNIPIPGGPARAPFPCCDPDLVIDDASRVIFFSYLYLNNAGTDGIARLFVKRTSNTTTFDCWYNIATGPTNVVPDYPHLGLTQDYLYLTTNNIPAAGSSFRRITRYPIDTLAKCQTVTGQSFTQSGAPGQRVWVPSGGTNNFRTMYWTQLENSSTMRIYRWKDDENTIFSTTRGIATSNFTNPDCRGGINNADWIERSTAWSIAGFRMRCALAPGYNYARDKTGVLACYWNVGTDASHTQGHVHSAVFDLTTLNVISQPHIWNNNHCFGYPAVSSSKRGDIGLSIAWGGRAGGNSTAAQGAVGLDDSFNAGAVGSFGTVFTTASGDYNRPDGRFGDYFSVRPHEPCEKWFTATNYALLGGTSATNVNSRIIQFGRRQSNRCYWTHRLHPPIHLQ